ncbi:hypothetical protein F5Y15DRAFT_369164 [Xylariaceae sp. FL0016]|nr:hypothetical protein F5Y15DRAFT_369164 [Xylariaceae sp. FL0016]
MEPDASPPHFFTLPRELRDLVYGLVLAGTYVRLAPPRPRGPAWDAATGLGNGSLLLVCRQCYFEARLVYWHQARVHWYAIETPRDTSLLGPGAAPTAAHLSTRLAPFPRAQVRHLRDVPLSVLVTRAMDLRTPEAQVRAVGEELPIPSASSSPRYLVIDVAATQTALRAAFPGVRTVTVRPFRRDVTVGLKRTWQQAVEADVWEWCRASMAPPEVGDEMLLWENLSAPHAHDGPESKGCGGRGRNEEEVQLGVMNKIWGPSMPCPAGRTSDVLGCSSVIPRKVSFMG